MLNPWLHNFLKLKYVSYVFLIAEFNGKIKGTNFLAFWHLQKHSLFLTLCSSVLCF